MNPRSYSSCSRADRVREPRSEVSSWTSRTPLGIMKMTFQRTLGHMRIHAAKAIDMTEEMIENARRSVTLEHVQPIK